MQAVVPEYRTADTTTNPPLVGHSRKRWPRGSQGAPRGKSQDAPGVERRRTWAGKSQRC